MRLTNTSIFPTGLHTRYQSSRTVQNPQDKPFAAAGYREAI
jgi:hypothetical protein